MGHASTVRQRILLYGAAVVLATTATARAQDPAATLGKLAVQGCDFALDPVSGNLAAVDPRQEQVVLYKPEPAGPDTPIAPIARTTLRGLPVTIVYKRLGAKAYFAVGCLKEGAIYLLNAADLKEEARIPISQGCLGLATAASPRDPYLYYYYGSQYAGKAGVVNLETKRDFGDAFVNAWEIAVSGEGNFIYSRRHNPWVIRRVLPSTPADKPTFQMLTEVRDNAGDVVSDPFETRTVIGPKAFSPPLDTEFERLPMPVKAFFVSKPLAIGFNSDESGVDSGLPRDSKRCKIVVASLNTGAKIGFAVVPPYFLSHRERRVTDYQLDHAHEQVGHLSRMFADDARGRIVVAWHDRFAVVTLADLRIPDEPYLHVDLDTPSPALVGRKNVLPLRPRDPRITIELAESRDDMRITAAGLEWTPPVDAVGDQLVKLRLRHGASEKVQDLAVRVEYESVALPFEADRIAVSFDEKEAFVWTIPLPDRENPFAPGADPNKNRPQGALINLADGRIIASGMLSFAPHAVAFDGSHVYAAGTDRLAALDRADFRIKSEIPVAGTIDVLRLADERSLAGCIGRTRRLKFSVPDLRLQLDYGPRDDGGGLHEAYEAQFQSNLKTGIWPAGDGWAAGDGDVFDRTFSRPILLQLAPSFIPINRLQSSVPFEPSPFQRSGPMYPRNDRHLVGFDRLPAQHAKAALIRSIAALEPEDGSGRERKHSETFTLSITDWRDSVENGVPLRSIVVTQNAYKPNRRGLSDMDRIRGAIAVGGDVVYCTLQGKLYRIAPAVGRPASETPVAFDPKQSHLVLDRGGRTTLAHSVTGGVGPYTFSLIEPAPGLSIDAAGTVTADGARLTSLALDRLVGPQEPDGMNFGQWNQNLSSLEFTAAYMMRNGPLFQQIAGRPPTGFPVSVVIGVQATDRTPSTTKLVYQALLEIPLDQIAARLAAVAERSSRARAGGGMPRERRFENLERRIAALEAQIKSMTKLLEEAK